MLLPERVKLVMLSATIGNPEQFASWIGCIKQTPCHLIVHSVRPVSLNHQLYYPDGDDNGKKFVTYYKENVFQSEFYGGYFRSQQKKYTSYNETSYLNRLVSELKEIDRCPVLFFVFSRQGCERYARSLNINFHDVTKQAEVEHTVNFLLSKYQYNFQTLKLSHQITEIVELAKKGIGYHHASLLPVSKEIIEILFGKQLIKVMFVTETFSVGINMPTRTVVFTDLVKHVKGGCRPLFTDEFYQMAGRAGRRGLDSQGYVIYAPVNRMLSVEEMSKMIVGSPASFNGRFGFEYQNILQQILCQQGFEIVKRAYLYKQLETRIKTSSSRIVELENELRRLREFLVDIEVDSDKEQLLSDYIDAKDKLERLTETQYLGRIKISVDPKAKKDANKVLEKIKLNMKSNEMFGKKSLLTKYQNWIDSKKKLNEIQMEIKEHHDFLGDPEKSLSDEYYSILKELETLGFLKSGANVELTQKGILAARINNTDGMLIAELLESGLFFGMSSNQLGVALGIMTADLPQRDDSESYISEEIRDDQSLSDFWKALREYQDNFTDSLPKYRTINYRSELVGSTILWLRGSDFHETVASIPNLQGNFVRSMMRLLHLCEELIKCFSDLGCYLDLEVKLHELVGSVNRDLIVFDSIYIK